MTVVVPVPTHPSFTARLPPCSTDMATAAANTSAGPRRAGGKQPAPLSVTAMEAEETSEAVHHDVVSQEVVDSPCLYSCVEQGLIEEQGSTLSLPHPLSDETAVRCASSASPSSPPSSALPLTTASCGRGPSQPIIASRTQSEITSFEWMPPSSPSTAASSSEVAGAMEELDVLNTPAHSSDSTSPATADDVESASPCAPSSLASFSAEASPPAPSSPVFIGGAYNSRVPCISKVSVGILPHVPARLERLREAHKYFTEKIKVWNSHSWHLADNGAEEKVGTTNGRSMQPVSQIC